MLTLSEEQVKKLEAILNELPMKFGVPILNILNVAIKTTDETRGVTERAKQVP
jgi:hypothetical protein